MRPAALLLLFIFVFPVRAGPLADNSAALIGHPAPDFALKTLGGPNLRLSEFIGEVVLINFWAIGAGPSRQQMPALQILHATYASAGLIVLGVNVDADHVRAAEYAQALDITYPVLMDARRQVAPAYGLRRVPTTVLIDRHGVVRQVYAEYQVGAERRYLAELRILLDE